jgi:hypothetical protein
MNVRMGNGQQDTLTFHERILWTLRLGLILILISIPSFFLWLVREIHEVAAKVPPVFWGSWAVFSIWVILIKGLPRVIHPRKDILGLVWLFLGLINLFAAISGLCFL